MKKGELFSILEGIEDDEEISLYVDDSVLDGDNVFIHSVEIEVINNSLDNEVILNLRKVE